jgi:hypothetical protein
MPDVNEVTEQSTTCEQWQPQQEVQSKELKLEDQAGKAGSAGGEPIEITSVAEETKNISGTMARLRRVHICRDLAGEDMFAVVARILHPEYNEMADVRPSASRQKLRVDTIAVVANDTHEVQSSVVDESVLKVPEDEDDEMDLYGDIDLGFKATEHCAVQDIDASESLVPASNERSDESFDKEIQLAKVSTKELHVILGVS